MKGMCCVPGNPQPVSNPVPFPKFTIEMNVLPFSRSPFDVLCVPSPVLAPGALPWTKKSHVSALRELMCYHPTQAS